MIDFLKYRYLCMTASVVFLVVGIVGYFVKGGFQYHIDFVGGTELRVAFAHPLDTSQLRSALRNKGWLDLSIQSVGTSGSEFLIRTGQASENVETKFLADAADVLPENPVKVKNVEWVGAEVESDIQWNAFQAVLLSFLLLLLYIAFRSRYNYAVGAVVALAHDILLVLTYFLLFNEQISLNVLAALLTILGYSLNDTIIVYSRIRENVRKVKGISADELVNLSINQTLSRTILTSLATLLAVGAIFLFGGETLRGFSLAMIIGIVVGTYSSIYIASPVMLALGSPDKN